MLIVFLVVVSFIFIVFRIIICLVPSSFQLIVIEVHIIFSLTFPSFVIRLLVTIVEIVGVVLQLLVVGLCLNFTRVSLRFC